MVTLQVRFKQLVPMQLLSFAVLLSVMPVSGLHPLQALAEVALQSGLAVGFPLYAVHILEQHMWQRYLQQQA
jgi:hypothetical protein